MWRRTNRFLRGPSVRAGALLYIGMRWFDRLIGLLSTIVLARLLAPDDFGVIALATVVIGLAAMMVDFGVNLRVVQMERLEREDIDTAWTIRLLQGTLIATVIFLVAPLVAAHYDDPRMQPVIQVLALAQVILGLRSMGPVLFQRRREYAREVSVVMTRRLVSFLITVGIAWYVRSYWALVIGSLCASVFSVALSYYVYPVLCRPTLKQWRKFADASLWLTLRSIGLYASQQVDKLFIGKGGADGLGAYTLADQIGATPSSEMLAPISRALFPALARKVHSPTEFRDAFLLGFGIQVMIALPASVGLALTSEEAVQVLLGDKWAAAAPLLAVLAICYGVTGATSGFTYLQMAMGDFRKQSFIHWLNVGALVLVLSFFVEGADPLTVAYVRTALAFVVSAVLMSFGLRAAAAVSFRQCCTRLWRPLAGVAVMSASIVWLWPLLPEAGLGLALTGKIAVGAVSYTLTVLGLWLLAGRPEGVERWIIHAAKGPFRV